MSTHDTCIFLSSRLSSLHGYASIPSINSKLAFDVLPHYISYTGRLIQVGLHTWELWSPNSKRHPFCPGRSVAGFTLSPSTSLTSCRTDGHLGQFDPTISPQQYGPQLWRAF